MAKRYDVTTKQLVEAHPADWVACAGFPLPPRPAEAVRVVDADVSATLSPAADKVIRVGGDRPYIAHIEFLSGADSAIDGRVLLYNVVLRARHELPVRGVAFVLRPAALSPAMTGRAVDLPGGSETRLDFAYKVVRVWELSPESLPAGGLGTLPLATVADVAPEQLPEVVRRIEQRVDADAPPGRQRDLMLATYIMMGLRHRQAMIDRVLAGVRAMKESVTYQAILAGGREGALEEGLQQGLQQGIALGRAQVLEVERGALIQLGTKKLGPPDAQTTLRLNAITDVGRLSALIPRVLDVSTWAQLLADEP